MWKLLKPFYRLEDVSRKFRLKVRKLFLKMGLKKIEDDEAFHFLNEGGKLPGSVLTHVDDFTLAGDDAFYKIVIKGIETCMNVSKVEMNKFRYTDLDLERCLIKYQYQ